MKPHEPEPEHFQQATFNDKDIVQVDHILYDYRIQSFNYPMVTKLRSNLFNILMKELGVSFEDDEIAEMLLNMNLETVEDVKQFVKDREGLDLIYVNRDVEEEDE